MLAAIGFIYEGSLIYSDSTEVSYAFQDGMADPRAEWLKIDPNSPEKGNGSDHHNTPDKKEAIEKVDLPSGEAKSKHDLEETAKQSTTTTMKVTSATTKEPVKAKEVKNDPKTSTSKGNVTSTSAEEPTEAPYEHIPGCYLGKYCVEYLLKPEDHCSTNSSTKFLAFVLSRVGNFDRRNKIRRTWGNNTVFKRTDLRVVFILGKGQNYSEHEERIKQEAKVHNDIVLVDFVDNYENLTFKTLLGLHWSSHYCPNASFVLKTDDDVFINTFSFIDRVTGMINGKKDKRVIMGYVWKKAWVRRAGKYWMSKKQYKEKYYPPYCGGSAYVMSGDVVKILSELAIEDKRTQFFRMEDIYVTGILAKQAKINPFMIPNWGYSFNRNRFVESRWRDFIVWHNALNASQENTLWLNLLWLSGTVKRPKSVKKSPRPVQAKPRPVQPQARPVRPQARPVRSKRTIVQTKVKPVQSKITAVQNKVKTVLTNSKTV